MPQGADFTGAPVWLQVVAWIVAAALIVVMAKIWWSG